MSPEESLRIAVQMATLQVEVTVLSYAHARSYPYFYLDPCTIEVWVPPQEYLIVCEVYAHIRCIGERVILKVDQL